MRFIDESFQPADRNDVDEEREGDRGWRVQIIRSRGWRVQVMRSSGWQVLLADGTRGQVERIAAEARRQME